MSSHLLSCRKDFPMLSKSVGEYPYVYFDNAATTLKPQAVIDALMHYYRDLSTNVHRGLYPFAEEATRLFEGSRTKLAQFFGVNDSDQLVFTSGSTAGINLVARSFVAPQLAEDDEILVTVSEHHANIVPWQMICAEKKAKVVPVPLNADASFSLEKWEEKLTARTKFIAMSWISNALGIRFPVEQMVGLAKAKGIPMLIDGAQVPLVERVHLDRLQPDFFVCSGHKMLGPTGIGLLYGRAEHLAEMPPLNGGGDMIQSVSFEGTRYEDPPFRFEAGTPPIASVIGLGAAVDYLSKVDYAEIAAYEKHLLKLLHEAIGSIKGARILAAKEDQQHGPILGFLVNQVHPHDLATIMGRFGVAMRAGHHCAQPLAQFLGINASCRVSLCFYNNEEDVQHFQAALEKALKILR